MPTIEASVEVRCSSCGDTFPLAPSNVRRGRREGRPPVCRECRRKPRELDEPARARLRAWWIDRLGEAQAREVARMIWPRHETEAASGEEGA